MKPAGTELCRTSRVANTRMLREDPPMETVRGQGIPLAVFATGLAAVFLLTACEGFGERERGERGDEGRSAQVANLSPQQRQEAKTALNNVLSSLRALDTAYAAGNTAEAQSDLTKAASEWAKVSPMISAREAREAQLVFDSLTQQLTSNAAAAKVSATVKGMIEELSTDVGRELG